MTKSWPELAEELSRKALDVINDRAFKFGEGQLSAREMNLIASAVYDTVTGLIPWEDARIIQEVADETDQ